MERYFTVIVRYPDGEVKTFNHVSYIHFSDTTNFCYFTDDNARTHYIMGSTVIADEEVPENNENSLRGDVIQ